MAKITRWALSSSPGRKRIVLDAGANVDCKPEHLSDFALMGSEYAEHALGISHSARGVAGASAPSRARAMS